MDAWTIRKLVKTTATENKILCVQEPHTRSNYVNGFGTKFTVIHSTIEDQGQPPSRALIQSYRLPNTIHRTVF